MQTDKNLVVELETPRFEYGKPLLIAGLREHLTDDAENIPALWQRFVPYIGALLAAVLPLIRTWGRVHRSRIKTGYCRHCGYDLRATPQRCPECGHIPLSKPTRR